MKIKLRWLLFGIIVCIAGVAFIGLGPKVGVIHSEPISGLMIGAGIVLIGLDGIFSGRSTEGYGVTGVTHDGMSARLRGAAFAFLGVVICFASLVEVSGRGNWQTLLVGWRGRGVIMFTVGLFGVLGSGLLFVDKPRGSNWLALPGRIAGALLLPLSLIAIIAGGLMIVSPSVTEALTKEILTRVLPTH